MNEQNNLPRSEFFASLNPNWDIKTLGGFIDEEQYPKEITDRAGAVVGRRIYGTLPPLPPHPLNSPAALSERRRAIRRADMMREVIGWAIVALAIAALGFILL